MTVDFQELKARVSIEQASQLLGLTLKQDGHQFRSACPACNKGGERAIVITPAKGVYYCFAEKKGGDQLALVQHIRGCTIKEAGQFLSGDAPVPEKKKGEEPFVLQPLAYLEPEHELVIAIGFPFDVCNAVGIGYAPKGIMRGTVAVPIRLSSGKLVGYIGVENAKLPSQWRLTDE